MIPAACVLLALSFATYRQLGYWSSSYDLWAHTLAVTDKNFIAQDNLGGALLLLENLTKPILIFRLRRKSIPKIP